MIPYFIIAFTFGCIFYWIWYNTTNNKILDSIEASLRPQVRLRKVHLAVHQNIYENSSANQCVATPPPLPSPPLPPPPQQTQADIEFVGDLPLPPPPSVIDCDVESATPLTLSISHTIDICEQSIDQHLEDSPLPSKELSPPAPRSVDLVSYKTEIATQTTESLRRNSGTESSTIEMIEKDKSLETNEPMYENSVPTNETTIGEEMDTNKSMESVVPWAYSKLWPNEKCVKRTHYESDDYMSGQTSAPIRGVNSFIDDTGVEVTNEDLLTNKSDLISRLSRKLDVLRSEEMALSHDIESNEILGQEMRTKLKTLGLTAQESEKIDLHCDETEKVTRLLLSISARLQSVEIQINRKSRQKCKANENECKRNSFSNPIVCELIEQTSKTMFTQNDLQQIKDKQTYCSNNLLEDMQSLMSKRQKLLIQLEEALQLRVSIEHRNQLIEEKILKKYFANKLNDLNEFLEFIKLKSKLIVDIREVRDKIQMGERQLCALHNN